MHIVAYTCEQCGAEHTRAAGLQNTGMCPTCGSAMKIDDLFSDRREVSIPVDDERRDQPRPEAA
jgi:rRNA maturation endonuclease Nob1